MKKEGETKLSIDRSIERGKLRVKLTEQVGYFVFSCFHKFEMLKNILKIINYLLLQYIHTAILLYAWAASGLVFVCFPHHKAVPRPRVLHYLLLRVMMIVYLQLRKKCHCKKQRRQETEKRMIVV